MGQAPQPPQPPISDTPTDITTEAIINNPDGSLNYRELHTKTKCTRKQQEMIYDSLLKQQQFIEKELENPGQRPEIIMSATLKATGMPDLHYDTFTYDQFQKAKQNWDKLGDQLLKDAEKDLKGHGKP